MRRSTMAILAAVLLAGCGATSQNTHLDNSPGAYPAGLQGKLTGACSAAVASSSKSFPSNYCQCALQTLEANLPASSAQGNAYVDGEAMISDPDILSACKG